jgi:hypothetical protein
MTTPTPTLPSTPTTPTVRFVTLVEIACTGCGPQAWDAYYDDPPLFASLAEARTETTDDPDPARRWRWTPTRGGWAATCPTCQARAICDTDGHRWGAWVDCRCGASNPEHAQHGCRPWHACDRCSDHEYGPTPTTPAATGQETPR